MIVARVPGAQGGETYLRKGQYLPASVTSDETGRLLALGLVETVEIADPAPVDETPAEPAKQARSSK